jgi:hypothetical protein
VAVFERFRHNRLETLLETSSGRELVPLLKADRFIDASSPAPAT